jgi:hypothetical protein
MRYVIKIKCGRKVINTFKFADYLEAMKELDRLEASADFDQIVEFYDTKPFASN